MRKNWNKPTCTTLLAKDLSLHIKAAARSWCAYGVLR